MSNALSTMAMTLFLQIHIFLHLLMEAKLKIPFIMNCLDWMACAKWSLNTCFLYVLSITSAASVSKSFLFSVLNATIAASIFSWTS